MNSWPVGPGSCDHQSATAPLLRIGDTAIGQDKAELGRLVGQAQELEKQERFVEAITTYNRAADLATRLFGANHVDVGTLNGSSGQLNRQLGQLVESE